MKGTKANNFKRIATRRTNEILNKIESLKALKNKSFYEWNNNDIKKIFKAIRETTQEAEAYLLDKKKKAFNLNDEKPTTQAKEQRRAILEEREGFKSLINDMIYNYEASESGTDDNTLKAYYRAKICGLLDLLQEIKNLEDIEAEEQAGGEDISTATYNEIKAQNGEE